MGPLAQVGLALATSIGAWLNLVLVIWFAVRDGHFAFEAGLRSAVARLAAAGFALTIVLWLAREPVAHYFAGWPSWRDESALAVLAVVGAVVYGGVVLALFGPRWLAALRARKRSPAALPPSPPGD
jgi:putative peptidoglycan lipid II flippase